MEPAGGMPPPADIGELKPWITISDADSFLSLHNINLDLGKDDEQVLAVKSRSSAESPIRILVVAYDKVWNRYRTVYEAKTQAVNVRAFTVEFIDLVGDHNLEILCKGMTVEGELSLDVFRKVPSPSGVGLYYESICQITLDGTIEIPEIERSGAYQLGHSNGKSYPIITLTPDTESENIMDLIQRTYNWRFTESRYMLEKQEQLAGEQIQKEQLRALYRRNAKAFEDFLAGSWYQTDGLETSHTVILHFEPERRVFTYFTGELQEVYIWDVTYKRLMNRVELNGKNELVPFIRKQFYVQVDDLEKIRVIGSDSWFGSYRKLPEGFMPTPLSDGKELPDLVGQYVSDLGDILDFDYPRFELMQNEKKSAGGYSLYYAGPLVLELKLINETGIVSGSRRFRLQYVEEQRDDKVFRTLFLFPGIIGMYGFEDTENTFIRYEQIVAVEN